MDVEVEQAGDEERSPLCVVELRLRRRLEGFGGGLSMREKGNHGGREVRSQRPCEIIGGHVKGRLMEGRPKRWSDRASTGNFLAFRAAFGHGAAEAHAHHEAQDELGGQ